MALEVRTVARGAAVGLVAGGAAAVAANLVDAVNGDQTVLAFPLLVATLAGLGAGGWVAARACRRDPLAHSAAAALAGVTVLLAINLVRRVVTDDAVNVAYVAVWWLLAVACGLAGGLAALRSPVARSSPGHDPSHPAGRADSRP